MLMRGEFYKFASRAPDHLVTYLYNILSFLFLPELLVLSQSSLPPLHAHSIGSPGLVPNIPEFFLVPDLWLRAEE